MIPKTLILLILSVIVLPDHLISQRVNFDRLSKKEYYADFDTLQKWITTASPIHLVNDKLKKQSFQLELKRLRSKIAYTNTIEDFYRLVYDALNLVQEPHTALSTKQQLVSKQLLYPQKDTEYVSASCRFYDSIRTKVIRKQDVKPNFPIAYLDGCYKVYYPFKIGGIRVDTGYFVSSINGEDIHKLIKSTSYSISLMKYDFKNDRSYYEDFFRLREIYNTKDSAAHLLFSKADEKVLVKFRKTDSVVYDKRINLIGFNKSDASKKIIYFDSLNVLYIRMPQMSNGSFYINELSKYKTKSPKKVIFDIRGNGGGQDWVWASVLKQIICNNQIVRPVFLGIRNNPLSLAFLNKLIPNGEGTRRVMSLPVLPDEKFYTVKSDSNAFYGADSNSINYNGNIYVMCSGYEYSSAGNLIDMAKSNSKIITVGKNTGLIGGLELSPVPLILPKTKIIFNLAINLDLKEVLKVSDLYHNQIEVPIEYSLDDLFTISSQYKDVSDIGFLLHNDPIFKKILEID